MHAKGVGKCTFPTPFALVMQRLQFIFVTGQGISLLDSVDTMVANPRHSHTRSAPGGVVSLGRYARKDLFSNGGNNPKELGA